MIHRQQSQASLWIVATAAVIRNSSSISSYFCRRYRVSSCSSSNAGSNHVLAGRWHGSTSSKKSSIHRIIIDSSSSSSVTMPSLLSLFISANIISSSSRMTPIAVTTTPRTRKMSTTNNMTIEKHPQVKNRVALLQLPVTYNKDRNLQTAIKYIRKAQSAGARLCVLPEIWNSPYATAAFPEYAELLPQVGDSLPPSSNYDDDDDDDEDDDGHYTGLAWGKSPVMLMEMAKATNMYIVGGSIPEVMVHHTRNKNDKSNADKKRDYYNTCLVINPHGKVVAKHRKVHLFDVNVPGGIQFKESETLTAGDLGATYFDVAETDNNDDDDEGHKLLLVDKDESRISSCELGRIGVGICYDIRFPEYALLLTQIHQCKILIYPGAFNLTTGPAHWELLQRARAVDGQCYVLTASPARMPTPSPSTIPDDNDVDVDPNKKYPHYSAWGHSSVISPWGEIIATCDETPAVVIADLDMDKVEEMRMAIPTMMQKRHDLYRLVEGSSAPLDNLV